MVIFDAIDTLFMAYPDKVGMYQKVIEGITGKHFSREEIEKVWDRVVREAENLSLKNVDDSKKNNLAWDDFNKRILHYLGIRENLEENSARLLDQAWDEPSNYRLFDDVLEVLEGLKRIGIRIACLSNEDKGLNKFFDYFKVKEYFDFVITSSEFGYEKPHPFIFEEAVKQSGLEKKEILFVGDSYTSDYLGAMKAGLPVRLIDREDKYNDKNIKKIKSLVEILGR